MLKKDGFYSMPRKIHRYKVFFHRIKCFCAKSPNCTTIPARKTGAISGLGAIWGGAIWEWLLYIYFYFYCHKFELLFKTGQRGSTRKLVKQFTIWYSSFIESIVLNTKLTFNFGLAATFLIWATLKFQKWDTEKNFWPTKIRFKWTKIKFKIKKCIRTINHLISVFCISKLLIHLQRKAKVHKMFLFFVIYWQALLVTDLKIIM